MAMFSSELEFLYLQDDIFLLNLPLGCLNTLTIFFILVIDFDAVSTSNGRPYLVTASSEEHGPKFYSFALWSLINPTEHVGHCVQITGPGFNIKM